HLEIDGVSIEVRPVARIASQEAQDMNTQTTTSQFLLLARGTHWPKGLSAEETQKILSRCSAWFDRLSQRGKAKVGQPLAHEGKIVSEKRRRSVTDGPFAESKEAIAGYFLLQADGEDEAVEIARDWPILEIEGTSIEIRPLVE